ncbi:MAG: NUDIX domain-containing protein [Deltaproteobacteria bacterium]|jgi:8-oxo-dGTP pyrophosphatase MutT (NUDIX family)|nr:NUDIX domain-containing protein [Deltaproteobacteria bacterium]MBT6435392.1 NUDIX domain-containing protein [Deltaproteobacteria bacterium]MBT6492052.1 NUDIX domain-containing protein [Deltaproteobacteria bacterium]
MSGLPETLQGTRDASTVVVLRDRDTLEVLLMQRHSKSGFMGGAYVFPGGKVDDTDCLNPNDASEILQKLISALDSTPGTAPSKARKMGFAVAACRELFEESGLLLGADLITRNSSGATLDPAQGRSFNESLMEVDMFKAIESLHYFAHWVTPSFEKKRFDTRFFVARAPEGQELRPDPREVTDLVWLPIRTVLERQSQNEIVLPPPTLKILEDLVSFEKVDEVIECTRHGEVQALMPKIVSGMENCSLTVILPWDENYELADGESLVYDPNLKPVLGDNSVSRIELFDGAWRTAKGVVG